jgi:hypothetical protein
MESLPMVVCVRDFLLVETVQTNKRIPPNMTNEQLAALLRPYLEDLSNLSRYTEHVIPGSEAMMLSVFRGRLEVQVKTLRESIARLDNPLVYMNPKVPVNGEHIRKVMYGDDLGGTQRDPGA